MKDYAIYFFTLILGVAIFYVFNSIGSQTAMMTVSKSTSEMPEAFLNILIYSRNSLRMLIIITRKHRLLPIIFEIGSARNTPSVPI